MNLFHQPVLRQLALFFQTNLIVAWFLQGVCQLTQTLNDYLAYDVRDVRGWRQLICPSFSLWWISAQPMLLQCFNIISQESEFVAPKMKEIIPRINPSSMQIVKKDPRKLQQICKDSRKGSSYHPYFMFWSKISILPRVNTKRLVKFRDIY